MSLPTTAYTPSAEEKAASLHPDDDGKASKDEQLEQLESRAGARLEPAAQVALQDANLEKPLGYVPANDHERALDRGINLRFDFIVLPIMTLNYILASLDKNSLGNALTAGFIEDTGFEQDVVNNAVSMTAVSIVFAPFMIATARRVGVPPFMAVITLGWGLCTIGSAFCKNQGVFYFVRMLQAILEVPLVQLSLFYLTTLYPRANYGVRLAIFTGIAQFGGAFGNLIAYGVFKIKGSHLHVWQILFVIYGAISCSAAFAVYGFLPTTLSKSWILTPEQRAHAVERMARDVAIYTTDSADGKNVGWKAWKFALKDWQKLLILLAQVCIVMPVVGFLVFCPIVVGGMGYSGVKANLMSVTPFVCAAAGVIAFQKSSDHFRERSLHTIAALILSVIGLAVMIGSNNNRLRYAFLHICLGGAFAPGVTVAAWLGDNTPEASTRSVVFGLLGLTGVSQVIAGQIYKPKYAPSFKTPLLISMGFSIAAIVVFASVRVLYMIENKKRRNIIASMTPEEIAEERANTVRMGDRKLTFIRTL